MDGQGTNMLSVVSQGAREWIASSIISLEDGQALPDVSNDLHDGVWRV